MTIRLSARGGNEASQPNSIFKFEFLKLYQKIIWKGMDPKYGSLKTQTK